MQESLLSAGNIGKYRETSELKLGSSSWLPKSFNGHDVLFIQDLFQYENQRLA